MAGNGIPAIASDAGVAVDESGYSRDIVPPRLESYELDMDDGSLTCTFNDVVDTSSLKMKTHITLQSQKNALLSAPDVLDEEFSLTLRGGTTDSSNTYTIVMKIPEEDVELIKRRTNLASSIDNTFISLKAELLKDADGTAITPIISDNALKASKFTPDTTPPILSRFDIDLEGELLNLEFSEVVDISSFDAKSITIQSYRAPGPVPPNSHTLTTGYTLPAISDPTVPYSYSKRTFSFKLQEADLNEIKKDPELAVSIDKTPNSR